MIATWVSNGVNGKYHPAIQFNNVTYVSYLQCRTKRAAENTAKADIADIEKMGVIDYIAALEAQGYR